MHDPPCILAVDDTPENLEILRMRLEANGYAVETAADGEEGLAKARELQPDLILLDIMMPKLDGISVVRMLKADDTLRSIPVILVTAKADTRDVVEGLDAGGDDYLTKPFEHRALLARVRSMLRQKALHDTVEDQARRLEEQAAQLAAWNRSLEQTVAEQVAEIERMARLRRFLPEQVADLIVAAGRWRRASAEPSSRGHRGLLRSARLYRLCRDCRARRGDGGSWRVSLLPRRTNRPARRDLGAVRGRRHRRRLQRSAALRRPHREGRLDGHRHA